MTTANQQSPHTRPRACACNFTEFFRLIERSPIVEDFNDRVHLGLIQYVERRNLEEDKKRKREEGRGLQMCTFYILLIYQDFRFLEILIYRFSLDKPCWGLVCCFNGFCRMKGRWCMG